MDKLKKLSIQCDESIKFHTKHLDMLREHISVIESSKRTLKDFDSNSDLSLFIEMENLNNYISISTLDLSVNLKNLILAETDWERISSIKN